VRGLSRREFLGGAAGVIAVAALPPAGTSRAAATTPLAGATLNPSSYGITSYLDAANIYNGYVGMPLATTFEKVYMGHGAFPPQPPAHMTELAPSGCQFLVSIEPSRTMTTSEQKLVAQWLAMLSNSGIQYPGCGFMAVARALEYFPANPAPDELWMDYYATAFRGGSRLGNLIAKAQAAGTSCGLAEWGWAAGDTTFGPMTMPWWNTYCNYLMNLIKTGKITLGAINFAAKANGRTPDVINSASDPRIPMIRAVAQAMQGAA